MTLVKKISTVDYAFSADSNSIKFIPVIKRIVTGALEWPLINLSGKTYLNSTFTFVVPKGIDYLEIIVPIKDNKVIRELKIKNIKSGVQWIHATGLDNMSVVHVSHYSPDTEDSRVSYSLQLNSNSIEYSKDNTPIIFRYGKEINAKYKNYNKLVVEDVLAIN